MNWRGSPIFPHQTHSHPPLIIFFFPLPSPSSQVGVRSDFSRNASLCNKAWCVLSAVNGPAPATAASPAMLAKSLLLPLGSMLLLLISILLPPSSASSQSHLPKTSTPSDSPSFQLLVCASPPLCPPSAPYFQRPPHAAPRLTFPQRTDSRVTASLIYANNIFSVVQSRIIVVSCGCPFFHRHSLPSLRMAP